MIEFINATFDRSDEYKEFILSHEDAAPVEKHAWVEAAKAGKKVIPYCESYPEDEPNRDPRAYAEFVDSDLNIYVEFFDRDTKEFIEAFRYTDEDHKDTILVDNLMYGNPLGLEGVPNIWRRSEKS